MNKSIVTAVAAIAAAIAAVSLVAASTQEWRQSRTSFMQTIDQKVDLHRVIDGETGVVCYIAIDLLEADSRPSSISCVRGEG